MAGELVYEGQAVFPPSIGANTNVDLNIPSGGILGDDEEADFEVVVRNPSTITALTVRLKSKEIQDAIFGGGITRYPVFQTLNVVVNTPEGQEFLVHGWQLAAAGGRVTVSNDQALAGGQGFSAEIRIRKL